MSFLVFAQFGESASVTRTFVSVAAPLLVTVSVKLAVPPAGTCCTFGLFVMSMLAATQFLTASPVPPAAALVDRLAGRAGPVDRLTDWPDTLNVLVAVTVLVPFTFDVITTVQLGAAAV